MNEDKKYEYKGVVAKSSDSCYLFFEKAPGDFSDGFPITDSEGIYKHLKAEQLTFCKVRFCDGTIAMPVDSFSDLSEAFIQIQDLAVITVLDKEQNETNALEALEKAGDSLLESFFKEPIFK